MSLFIGLARKRAGAFAAAAVALAIALGAVVHPEPAGAADTKQETALKKQVAILQAELKAATDQIGTMQQQIAQRDTTIALLKAPKVPPDIQKQLAVLKKKALVLTAMQNAPYVHTVVLKLKKDTSGDETQSILNDLPALGAIASVRGIWFGTPATKATPDVAASNYDVALTVLFDDYNGLKSYLADSIHKKFVDKHMKYWETPVVYDYFLNPSP
jgi:hypothetical protein